MLEEVRLRGLGIIEDAVLQLHPGLTVVTGETGAGKTMVVQGLSLLRGARADSGALRPGAQRAVIEGRLHPSAQVRQRAEEAGAELDEDGALLVRRVLTAEGRSRAALGGAGVPVAMLSSLVGAELQVHGQHDALALLRGAEQRAALDRAGGAPVAAAVSAYRVVWAERRAVVAELDALTAQAGVRAQEAELLRVRLDRVAAVDPQPGEDDELRVEADRLRNAEALRTAGGQALQALSGDPDSAEPSPDVAQLLDAARRSTAAAQAYDPALAGLSARLAELAVVATDVAADLSSWLAGVDDDPARLGEVEQRLAALAPLARAHGPSIAEVLQWRRHAAERLLEVEGGEERGADLRARKAALDGELGAAALALREARGAAAAALEVAVTAELAALAMPQAELRVEVRPIAPGPDGADEVELLLRTSRGAPTRQLTRGASGGELSRVMLALHVAGLGGSGGTHVFDEVDAGVGGRAAVEVGRRLALLARDHQVVCVTHLPQVAAFADRHLRVVKSSDGSVTASDVEALEGSARIRELSRMLAGLDDSALAQAHAEELLAAAALAKAP